MFAVFGTAVSAIVIGGGIYLLGKVRIVDILKPVKGSSTIDDVMLS